jgi:1-acyl-sn-glycerol-3-phosphate acyltransferase
MAMKLLERLVQGKWFYWANKWLGFQFGRCFYDLQVLGSEKIPREGGLVITCNHISTWDPPFLAGPVPREIHFMAKKELFEGRWSRLLMLGLRAFPVDRREIDIGAIKEALRRLNAGLAVGIFAQGTRNSGDAQPFDGAAFLATRAGVPLQPAAIWRRGRRYGIRFGDPIRPTHGNRKALTEVTRELMRRVDMLLPTEMRLQSPCLIDEAED